MTEYAKTEWNRARMAMEAARRVVDVDPDSAASRAYYAAFHALTAVFSLRGGSFSRHSAIRAALHQDLVKPGHLDKRWGQVYDHLMDLRETADYGGLDRVGAEGAWAAIEKASSFMAACAALHPELGDVA